MKTQSLLLYGENGVERREWCLPPTQKGADARSSLDMAHSVME